MKNERYDSIEYNDEWQSVPVVRAEPVQDIAYDDDPYEEDEFPYDEDYQQENGIYQSFINKKKKTNTAPQPVIKLQFLIAIIAVAGAFLLKNFGGELYTIVSEWYFKNLNNSLVVSLMPTEESATQTATTFSTATDEPTSESDTIQPTDLTTNSSWQPTQPDNVTEPSNEQYVPTTAGILDNDTE